MEPGLRLVGLVSLVCALLMANAAATAQEMDVSFSDEKLRALDYPEIAITVGPDGVDAPSALAAGFYLITLQPTDEFSAYVDIMQPPDGLSMEDATDLALQAAANDLAQPEWGYVGGTNTFDVGVPTSFAIHLEPGEHVWTGSYYAMEEGAEDFVTLAPLTVTGGDVSAASPVAEAAAEPPLVMQFTYVAYAALQSGGTTTWTWERTP